MRNLLVSALLACMVVGGLGSVWDIDVSLDSQAPADIVFTVVSTSGNIAVLSGDNRAINMTIDTAVPKEGYALILYNVSSSLDQDVYCKMVASIPYDSYAKTSVQEQYGLNCLGLTKHLTTADANTAVYEMAVEKTHAKDCSLLRPSPSQCPRH